MTIGANAAPAQAQLQATVAGRNTAHGTMTIDGNSTLANGKINATVTYANGRTGTIQINANTAATDTAINNAARPRTATVYVRTVCQNAAVRGAFGGGSVRGLAEGGILVR